MAKFGEIINSAIPTLIDFHSNENDEEKELQTILKKVATSLGDKVRVIKIDISKNEELISALRIDSDPTYIIYKNGDMKWRQSGQQDANSLINRVEQFV